MATSDQETEKVLKSATDPNVVVDDNLQVLGAELPNLESKIKNLLFNNDDCSQSTTTLNQRNGISLLDLKNQIMIGYIQNLINLCAIRIMKSSKKQQSLELDQDKSFVKTRDSIVEQLVWYRLVMEKIKPMEARLKYQIEKLLKKAQDAKSVQDVSELDIENVINDPLSFKPNPLGLEPQNHSEKSVGREEFKDLAEKSDLECSNNTEIYRPPRVAPVAYPPAASSSSTKRQRPAPAPTALKEHVSLSTTAPLAESVTGLSNPTGNMSSRAKALARMNEYEEQNLMRLYSSKKESKKRRQDEAAIALGIETSGHGQKRKIGGLESEFIGVLGDIGKKSDRYASLVSSSANSKHKRQPVNSNFAKNSTKRRSKGAFERAVAKASKK
ncbi:hypothetical protein BY996DRAFT_4645708 [Phakopsora pachyrhizi]|uniref:Uncharacterized protein n=1 Tax=Phakopsora pachyrhizi TaxID=170000 RepID=A0AAV0BEA9_PHAPC|nr:hypothetical protein BY996DRAFT_8106626 [Phakopsora pachyrhizi]KAI8447981.1 hypothetical protein BY996DRAFT_4645708 [Phakopsora pachyrhizi]CAH7684268.1 hypothetical protein PPACK8108_LOCUS18347 [Phakopsora pachyrhizi]CAH7689956.1 hypothetical protein PPACK8108_LOCUS25145 [Phakopsora pachyrhizi]